MTSTLFTRRAMLSGGALAGLGALLAACGQQAANEASASASSTAAPTETASASESPSASATPSPVITRGYSGGSKAPDGEYRKADEYGPAQNVPLPNAKPQQYPETFAGLREMMRDWIKARNYGIQTGDMQYVRPYMLETFKEDTEFLDYIEKLYKGGGWVIEGTSEYQAESDLMYDEEAKEYWVLTRRLWTYGLYIHPNGKMRKRTNTGNENETFMFRYRYMDGYWYLSEYRSNEELRKQGIIQ
ncbi:DUF6318 family protein [Rothia mucilaginosa]|uniref:DUF6318 family protein n=1 Tax=Rothia mucilaginosa TaxID=43675 RepID=UPI0034D408BB